MANMTEKYVMENDYAIMNRKFPELQFVNGVAIYYDETQLQKKYLGEYESIENWIDAYCRRHDIPVEPFRNFVTKFNHMIAEAYEACPTFSIKLQKELFDELNSIKKVGYAGSDYSYQQCFHYITRLNQVPHCYSLVTEDKRFLMDKHFMYLSRFYHNISINEYGLFRLESRQISYDRSYAGYVSGSSSVYLWDTKCNYSSEEGLSRVIKMLINSGRTFNSKGVNDLLAELEDYRFETVNWSSNVYREKPGKYSLPLNQVRQDGLLFYTKEFTRPRSDSYTEVEFVKDISGESMSLNEFYHGLLMLKNGRNYMDSLNKLHYNLLVNT